MQLTKVPASAGLASVTDGTVCNVAILGVGDLDLLVAVRAAIDGQRDSDDTVGAGVGVAAGA